MSRGLVLQGGGALGAFELGVIEWLLDNDLAPDVVSGVSIGAINAAVLCGCANDKPKVALRQLWDALTTLSLPPPLDAANGRVALLGNPGMYAPRTDYQNLWSWTSLYDMTPLQATLKGLVNFDKLGPKNFQEPGPAAGEGQPRVRAPRLILTATNLLSGKLDRFDSKHLQLTGAHVAASGSLPPSFPPTRATAPRDAGGGEQLYWDGGLFDNTPLSKVIKALGERPDPNNVMYVVTLFPSAAREPRNFSEVATRIMTLAFSNKSEKDLRRAHRTTEIIRFVQELDRLMDQHPELRPLEQHPGYRAVKELAAPVHIIEITNMDVSGAADFSADAIERRRRQGYTAAADAIRKPRKLAA